MDVFTLDGEHLSLDDVIRVAHAAPTELQLTIADSACERMARSRGFVEQTLASGQVAYGINTGFGAFKDRLISPEQVTELQRNIVVSHSVGVGAPLSQHVVRAAVLIRANTLARGHSGVRPELVAALVALLNRGVYPILPSQGSLGASGDLAPLAHMALVLIGEGEAVYEGEKLPGGEALRRAGLSPVVLEAKEGLALTNGTAVSCAVGCLTTREAENLADVADVAGCLSLEALHGTPDAFDAAIHALRPHPRQAEAAADLRRLIEGSTFVREHDPHNVQDAYTLRCMPQVHGAIRDSILYARWVLEIELNSVTDNPVIVFDELGRGRCLSGGNFHGEPVALAMDYLKIALTELGNIAERRLTRLTDEASNQNTLPAFLTRCGGLNSGFMLVQYTAASLASENKVLVHPASADTIPTSANTEDHVSNSTTAARQAWEIVQNVERILAIELFAAAQAIDFRREALGPTAKLGRGTGPVYDLVRAHVPFLDRDAVMYAHIEAVRRLIRDRVVMDRVKAVLS
jgi:histidine ammonia-lyase